MPLPGEHFVRLNEYLAHAASEKGYDFTQPQTILLLVREEWDVISDQAALLAALGSAEDATKAERIAVLEAELDELRRR